LPGRARAPEQIGPGLGTFGGVFTPSILTILGVIMYLRLGWVVGNVGLGGTLLIVTLASAITFLTGLSVSAISTDQQIRTGGAYYMISRSLGVEVGGAVGIPLYLAQALSMALYTVGFAESVERVFPALDEKTVGIVTTLLVALLALRSARTAIRAQYFIMGAIALSLLSLLLGSPLAEPVSEATTAGVATEPFWVVFAVFFPAVTGIMAGVNLSGDLRNPTRSIPIGTLAAIGVGFVVYMTIPILLASRADQASLLADPLIMRRVSFWGDAILLGVWGATLSSAVGSILGAGVSGQPQHHRAHLDDVLPYHVRRFERGSGRRALRGQPVLSPAVHRPLVSVPAWRGRLHVGDDHHQPAGDDPGGGVGDRRVRVAAAAGDAGRMG
jgi:amino acid transporter